MSNLEGAGEDTHGGSDSMAAEFLWVAQETGKFVVDNATAPTAWVAQGMYEGILGSPMPCLAAAKPGLKQGLENAFVGFAGNGRAGKSDVECATSLADSMHKAIHNYTSSAMVVVNIIGVAAPVLQLPAGVTAAPVFGTGIGKLH